MKTKFDKFEIISYILVVGLIVSFWLFVYFVDPLKPETQQPLPGPTPTMPVDKVPID